MAVVGSYGLLQIGMVTIALAISVYSVGSTVIGEPSGFALRAAMLRKDWPNAGA